MIFANAGMRGLPDMAVLSYNVLKCPVISAYDCGVELNAPANARRILGTSAAPLMRTLAPEGRLRRKKKGPS